MAVYQYKFGPFTQADGVQTISLPQANRQYFNHAITIAYPSGELPSSGTILMQARRSGGTFFEDLDTDSTIDATKPAKVIVNARATHSVTLLALTAVDKVELRIGQTAASVLSSTMGFQVGVWESGITGLSVMVGASIQDGGQLTGDLPAGWYFAVNRISGNNAKIVNCFTQSLTA